MDFYQACPPDNRENKKRDYSKQNLCHLEIGGQSVPGRPCSGVSAPTEFQYLSAKKYKRYVVILMPNILMTIYCMCLVHRVTTLEQLSVAEFSGE